MKLKQLLVAGFVLALLIAGVASYYASGHPDGLEYVAGQTGLLDEATDSATARGPFADYNTKGIDNSRLSGGVAGLVGTGVVALLSGGLFWIIRRRPADERSERSGRSLR